jgi:NDP-sugar pyrophosphorylase family protein
MSAAGESISKPLVAVHGVSLLERNLWAILAAGVSDIVVSVSSSSTEVADFVLTRGRKLCEVVGAHISVLEEQVPRGNIGCASDLRGFSDTVLVVFADNLTTLSLRALLDAHRVKQPALTLAVHRYRYRLPYGATKVAGDRVLDYVEKPELTALIASGFAVLGGAAFDALDRLQAVVEESAKTEEGYELDRKPSDSPGRTVGIGDLTAQLIREGRRVFGYEHDSVWIDVNDRSAVREAERLIAKYSASFDLWYPQPERNALGVLVRERQRGLILARGAGEQEDQAYEIPFRILASSEHASEEAATRLLRELGVDPQPLTRVTAFDDLIPQVGRMARFHIYGCDALCGDLGPIESRDASKESGAHWRWLETDKLTEEDTLGRILLRSVALSTWQA